jgi:CelD/BcsL family acetyltransferase involved in cellulose biosynthesis
MQPGDAQRAGGFLPATAIEVALQARELASDPDAGERVLTHVAKDVDAIRALRPDYERLQQVTGNVLPFALIDWQLTWCEHFLNLSSHIQDQPLFCVLRDANGECVAIVPLIVTHRRLGPMSFVTTSFVGADPGLTEISGPLVAPGYERATIQAVHERMAELPNWDWILWSGLNEAMTRALAERETPRWCKGSDDYLLDLPSSWEELRSRVTRNTREALRHCYNSLRRDGHRFEFVVASEPEEVRRALPSFFELHAKRAAMPWGPKHPDRFATPSLRAFLYDVCDRFAAHRAVRVFQLKIAGKIVASRLGFVAGGSVYLYYSGFEPAWARYSVMTTTVAETFKYCIAEGIRTVNLSPTPERSKLRWLPRRVEFHSALVNREFLPSRMACMAYRMVRSGNQVPARLLKGIFWRARDW